MATYDVVVIGAGPGGYPCAIRSAQLGLKTAIIERQYFGGTCLNVGCIPSKAMIHGAKVFDTISHGAELGITASDVKVDYAKMVEWKNGIVKKMTGSISFLLKKNGVDVFEGEGSFISKGKVQVKDASGKAQVIEAKNVVIATGSKITELPFCKTDGKFVINSTQMLDEKSLPKEITVVGGGFIGLEIGCYLSKLGSKVTVVEGGPQVLPGTDPDLVSVVVKKMEKRGAVFHLNTKLLGASGGKVEVETPEGKKSWATDKVLLTVGRRPNTDGLNLAAVGLQVNAQGFIDVDNRLKTKMDGIYAIGDVVGQPMLAHKGTYEGLICADVLAGKKAVKDARAMPWAIFVDPEIATVGLSEAEAKKTGRAVKIGKFPFAASGRAVSTQETDGFVKLIADAKTDELLGAHIVGPEASNLISEAATVIEMGGSAEDIALTIHTHPTLPETLMEAAEVLHGKPIHIFAGK